MAEGPPGERTARGAQRRAALIEATLRIIIRQGAGGVTHRAVAAEAAASHGSVLYYFGTRDALIHEVMQQVARRNAETMAAYWGEIEPHADDPRRFAELVARHSAAQLVTDRDMGIAVYELHLAAARDATLRAALRDWGRAYARRMEGSLRRLGSTDPQADAAQLTNVVGGLIIGQLALPRRDFERRILRPAIERLVMGLGRQ